MKAKKLLWLAIMLGLFSTSALLSCKPRFESPDHRFMAEKWTREVKYIKIFYPPTVETDCVVREIKTQRIILISDAKYETPNDVKFCVFSDDSKRFAAYYAYGDKDDEKSQYTWMGVWSVETGKFLYFKEEPGLVLVPTNVP